MHGGHPAWAKAQRSDGARVGTLGDLSIRKPGGDGHADAMQDAGDYEQQGNEVGTVAFWVK